MNKPNILIVSDTFDFASDYICYELEKRNENYVRINRNTIEKYEIELNIQKTEIFFKNTVNEYLITEKNLNSIFFRAPIFLRDIYQPELPPSRQLFRSQWSAFYRNLVVFEDVKWINNPQDTFNAESKMYQLKKAMKTGFNIPDTYLANIFRQHTEKSKYILKSIDTAIIKEKDKEGFVYSNVLAEREFEALEMKEVPVIIQNYLYPKIDVRVTIVGRELFAVKILVNGSGIVGDWRLQKDKVEYIEIELPEEIQCNCRKLMSELNLTFGAVDLIICNNEYYFVEINPTGEWAWLVDTAKLKIDKAICDELQKI